MVYIGLQSDHYVTLRRLVLPPPIAPVEIPEADEVEARQGNAKLRSDRKRQRPTTNASTVFPVQKQSRQFNQWKASHESYIGHGAQVKRVDFKIPVIVPVGVSTACS
jgi:hypothetical protein